MPIRNATYRSRSLSAPLLWYRHRGLRPADRYVASYPRSGSTWLRFMLFEVATGASSSFHDVDREMPDVGAQKRASTPLAGEGRLLKTHEFYRDDYTRGVYIVRDPRSVVLSEYRWATGMGLYRRSFDRFVEDFVAGRVHRFGSWAANVTSWLEGGAAGRGDLLVVRFEDMKADPIDVLGSASRFLGLPATPSRLRRAVEGTSLRNMQRKERDAGGEIRFRGKGGRRFIGRGESDGWASALGREHVEAIEDHAGPLLDRFGYEARRSA